MPLGEPPPKLIMSLDVMELYVSSIVGYFPGFGETLWSLSFPIGDYPFYGREEDEDAALGGLCVPGGLGVPLFEGSVSRDCGTAMRRLVMHRDDMNEVQF